MPAKKSVNKNQLQATVLALTEQNEALVKEVKILKSIFDDNLAGYWDWHIQDDYEYLSPGFKRMFGYRDNEMLNHPDSWKSIVHPDDLPRINKAINDHITKGKAYEIEGRYFHKDGSIVWVYSRGKVVEWDRNSKPVRMVGTHIDITSLKRTEEQLLESNLRFSLAVDGTHDGIWDWMDVDEAEEWWSPQFYKLLGYEDKEIVASLQNFHDLLHPADAKKTFLAISKHFKQDIPFNIEYRLKTKSGTYKWFHGRANLLRDKAGNPSRMSGCIADIDEKKKFEKRFVHTQKLESLGILAGGIAHDLN